MAKLNLLQKPIFALWIGTCGLVVVACLRSSDDTYNELFHIYYQPLIIMLAMFWLWGIAMRVFELMRVEYEACFSALEQSHLLSSRQVYQVTLGLLSSIAAILLYIASHQREGIVRILSQRAYLWEGWEDGRTALWVGIMLQNDLFLCFLKVNLNCR